MTAAVVVDFEDYRKARAKRIALDRAAFIRELAEELHYAAADDPEQYDGVVYVYEQMGWANPSDLRLAVEALRDQ